MGENGNGRWKQWAVGAAVTIAFSIMMTWTGCMWAVTEKTRAEITALCQRTSKLEAHWEDISRSLSRIESKVDGLSTKP